MAIKLKCLATEGGRLPLGVFADYNPDPAKVDGNHVNFDPGEVVTLTDKDARRIRDRIVFVDNPPNHPKRFILIGDIEDINDTCAVPTAAEVRVALARGFNVWLNWYFKEKPPV